MIISAPCFLFETLRLVDYEPLLQLSNQWSVKNVPLSLKHARNKCTGGGYAFSFALLLYICTLGNGLWKVFSCSGCKYFSRKNKGNIHVVNKKKKKTSTNVGPGILVTEQVAGFQGSWCFFLLDSQWVVTLQFFTACLLSLSVLKRGATIMRARQLATAKLMIVNHFPPPPSTCYQMLA